MYILEHGQHIPVWGFYDFRHTPVRQEQELVWVAC